MIYIYRRAASDGAREIAEEILLQGVRARRTQGQALRNLTSGDTLVCWGDHLATVPTGVKVLNNVPGISKFEEAQRLAAAGVATVQVARTPPIQRRPAPFVEATTSLRGSNSIGVTDAEAIARGLLRFVEQERARRAAHEAQPTVTEQWLPRSNNHVGGRDLLGTGVVRADYYSKKENITEEYRIHMLRGKSIRAGVKRAATTRPDGRTAPHEWIRSFDAGWKIHYEGFRSTDAQRAIAKAAIEALGLDFGAVDIGLKADGTLIVLEVNRAPGVEGGTATAYATKFIAFDNGTLESARPTRRNR